jgi:hypothetical protein
VQVVGRRLLPQEACGRSIAISEFVQHAKIKYPTP